MTKQLSDLKSWDVKRIDAMFEEHGTERYGIEQVARSFSLTESAAGAMATAIKERNAPKPVTESAPDLTTSAAALDADASRNAALAFRLHQQVNEADSRIAAAGGSMAGLSIQELQYLAAAAGSEAGMFGG